MMPLNPALAVTAALVLAVVLAQVTLRFVYSYALTERRFEVRLFGRFTIFEIARESIVAAVPWRFSLATLARSFATLRLGNRVFGRAIVIERRANFPRYVVVTPDDPDALLAAIDNDVRIRLLRRGSGPLS